MVYKLKMARIYFRTRSKMAARVAIAINLPVISISSLRQLNLSLNLCGEYLQQDSHHLFSFFSNLKDKFLKRNYF